MCVFVECVLVYVHVYICVCECVCTCSHGWKCLWKLSAMVGQKNSPCLLSSLPLNGKCTLKAHMFQCLTHRVPSRSQCFLRLWNFWIRDLAASLDWEGRARRLYELSFRMWLCSLFPLLPEAQATRMNFIPSNGEWAKIHTFLPPLFFQVLHYSKKKSN